MSNKQLTDKEYLASLNYKDTYYLTQLCQMIWEFVKNTPVPVYVSIFKKLETIYIKFNVGKDVKFYEVDDTTSYHDFIFRYKIHVRQFYPSYSYTEIKEIDLTEEEILEKTLKENISLNDAMFLTKKSEVITEGIIINVHFMKDEFIIKENNIPQLRMAGDVGNIIPVKILLSNIKQMVIDKKDGKEIRDYIFNNSVLLETMNEKENEVIIDYPNNLMMNFFKIHFDSLANDPLNKIISGVYKWGKYKIHFKDELIENDCLAYYRKRKGELK